MSRFHRQINRAAWERARLAVLERDHWRCCECGRAGRLEVDHIRPLAAGGEPIALANLQTLCRRCHIRKSQDESDTSPERKAWTSYMAAMGP